MTHIVCVFGESGRPNRTGHCAPGFCSKKARHIHKLLALKGTSAMCSAIVSLLLGILGWFATSFVAKPLLDFLNLRSLVLEEMIFTANVNQIVEGTPAYWTAVESLRRLGAKVQATDVTTSPLLRWFLSKWGYDLATAGRNLIGLSNALNVSGRHLHADQIEKGLWLPRTSTNEFLDAVKEEIRNPRR